jgi:nucleoside-diphosphate-sugar epimerase
MFMKEKVLVTGGAGFIGSWLCSELERRGFFCVVLDDLSTGEEKNLGIVADYELINGSITENEVLDKIPWTEISACYHLAAKGDVHESIEDPVLHYNVNVYGSFLLLERCRRYGIPLLFTSTCMVYGLQNIPENGIDESCPVCPLSPYAGTKLAAENLVTSYKNAYGMQIRIARPFNTYGPHQKTSNKEGGVIPVFLQRQLEKQPLHIFGTGAQTRDFLYVKDCAAFLAEFMQAGADCPDILNAGSDQEITISELALKIAGMEGSVVYREHPHPQSEIHRLRCNSVLARLHLNWGIKYSIEHGLQENREWLQKNL